MAFRNMGKREAVRANISGGGSQFLVFRFYRQGLVAALKIQEVHSPGGDNKVLPQWQKCGWAAL
ncbi:hypothetical protein [Microvirga sp. M2]|uniref:hypothetical protein n=1 Tax=Microvirga sp. M2 TaxID=3073270 RepID=UPI0039C24B06